MTTVKQARPPVGYFKGQNFMTPEIVATFHIRGGCALFAEVSKERPPYFPGRSRPLYGVTLEDRNGKRDDISKCVDSYEEAIAYLEELSA